MWNELQQVENCTVFIADDMLGEGPHWDEHRGILSRVDIHAGLLRLCDPATGEQSTQVIETPLGFAIPRRSGGYVMGIGLTIVLTEPDGSRRTLVDLSSLDPYNRFNDAVCDAQGRLWAGTMCSQRPDGFRPSGQAALYRIDPDGTCEQVLEDLTISNGMDWPDASTLMHVDSSRHRIDTYPVTSEGRLGERIPFAQFDPSDGLPDGLTIDDEGCAWVAFFGGGQVRRFDRQGADIARFLLPASCTTSVAFGGHDLGDLFVPTSRHRLSAEQVAQQPLAGSLFRLRPGVRGRVGHRFAG